MIHTFLQPSCLRLQSDVIIMIKHWFCAFRVRYLSLPLFFFNNYSSHSAVICGETLASLDPLFLNPHSFDSIQEYDVWVLLQNAFNDLSWQISLFAYYDDNTVIGCWVMHSMSFDAYICMRCFIYWMHMYSHPDLIHSVDSNFRFKPEYVY